DNFFLGQLGANAALAGLLFVAVSINVARIIEIGGLADRGFAVLMTLVGVLVMSALLLIPGQPTVAIGIEVVVVSVLVALAGAAVGLRGLRQTETRHRRPFAVGLGVFVLAFALCIV